MDRVFDFSSSHHTFYRTRYRGGLFVVKVGGQVIASDSARRDLMADIADFLSADISVLLIYGGGHLIDSEMERAGIVPLKIDGHRVTTQREMPIVHRVLAADIGAMLSASARAAGLDVLLLGCVPPGWADMRSVERAPEGGLAPEDISRNGTIGHVHSARILSLFSVPRFVACPSLGVDSLGGLNINADDVAVALAAGVGARKLIFLSDTDGVLVEGKSVTVLTEKDILNLFDSGVVTGGMRVKLENCLDALKKGVRRIHILNGFCPHALAQEVYGYEGSGTMILQETELDRYRREAMTEEDF